MTASSSRPRVHRGVASVLLHGSDRTALAAFGAGLALRAGARWTWVDCAPPRSYSTRPDRRLTERRLGPPGFDEVRPRSLRPPNVEPTAIGRVVRDTRHGLLRRLRRMTTMPELWQRLWACTAEPDGTLLVLNADALPSSPRVPTVLARTWMELLGEERLRPVVTYGGRPPRRVRLAFDRVVRVEIGSDGSERVGWAVEEHASGRTEGRTTGRTVLRGSMDRWRPNRRWLDGGPALPA